MQDYGLCTERSSSHTMEDSRGCLLSAANTYSWVRCDRLPSAIGDAGDSEKTSSVESAGVTAIQFAEFTLITHSGHSRFQEADI